MSTLLVQQFKTLAGAQKRAAFKNAHSDRYHYEIVRLVDGEIDVNPFGQSKTYTYRLNKIGKRAAFDRCGYNILNLYGVPKRNALLKGE